MKTQFKIDFVIIASFIAFVFVSACNSNPDRASEKLVQANTGQEVEKLNDADASFLMDAALLDLKMIRLSHLVTEKSTNKQIEDLAQNILSVHEKSYHDIGTIGEEHSQSIPNVMSESDKIEIEELGKAKDADFDTKLFDMINRDHSKYLPHFEQLAEKANNASVKNWSGEFVSSCKRIVEQVAQVSKTNNSTSAK